MEGGGKKHDFRENIRPGNDELNKQSIFLPIDKKRSDSFIKIIIFTAAQNQPLREKCCRVNNIEQKINFFLQIPF